MYMYMWKPAKDAGYLPLSLSILVFRTEPDAFHVGEAGWPTIPTTHLFPLWGYSHKNCAWLLHECWGFNSGPFA